MTDQHTNHQDNDQQGTTCYLISPTGKPTTCEWSLLGVKIGEGYRAVSRDEWEAAR